MRADDELPARMRFRQSIPFLRQYLGSYGFGEEENAAFNSTILPNYYRYLADFERTCRTTPDETDSCRKQARDRFQALVERVEKEGVRQCRRSDLYAMETYLFAAADDDYLLQAYPGLQERYRSLVGADAYRRYEGSSRIDLKAGSVDNEKVRADALFLLSEMRRVSIAIPRRESIRNILLWNLLTVGAIAATVVFLILFWIPNFKPWTHFPYLWVVSLMSLFGGVISVFRRITSLPEEELNLAQWGRVSLLMSPIVSMGFGIVLYYILAAGLINGAGAWVGGTIFPDLSKIGTRCVPECKTQAQEPAAPAVTPPTPTKPSLPAPARAGSRTTAGRRGPASSTRKPGAPAPTTSAQPATAPPPAQKASDCKPPPGKTVCFLQQYGGSVVEWIETFDFSQLRSCWFGRFWLDLPSSWFLIRSIL